MFGLVGRLAGWLVGVTKTHHKTAEMAGQINTPICTMRADGASKRPLSSLMRLQPVARRAEMPGAVSAAVGMTAKVTPQRIVKNSPVEQARRLGSSALVVCAGARRAPYHDCNGQHAEHGCRGRSPPPSQRASARVGMGYAGRDLAYHRSRSSVWPRPTTTNARPGPMPFRAASCE